MATREQGHLGTLRPKNQTSAAADGELLREDSHQARKVAAHDLPPGGRVVIAQEGLILRQLDVHHVILRSIAARPTRL